jgi:hypothetical protein
LNVERRTKIRATHKPHTYSKTDTCHIDGQWMPCDALQGLDDLEASERLVYAHHSTSGIQRLMKTYAGDRCPICVEHQELHDDA